MNSLKTFLIGNFAFSVKAPDTVRFPENFLLFERETEPEYTYEITVLDDEASFPAISGTLLASLPDITLYTENASDADRETRLLGVKGQQGFYAMTREVSANETHIWLVKAALPELIYDPVFVSLFSLERRMIERGGMILHCAYMVRDGKAILFSAPSETGKSTQAGLWEKYRGTRQVNGDRALLQKIAGVWTAQGWPVCGSSGICHNEAFEVEAIVMLSQAKENSCVKIGLGGAFTAVYPQVTVNRWNREASLKAMDLVEDLTGSVKMLHLACDISEEAVRCLEDALERKA